MKQKLKLFVESSALQNTIICLIILNAFTMGIQTYSFIDKTYGVWLNLFDRFVLKVFVVEIALRICVYRWRFFTCAWSFFDFAVVALALFASSEAFAMLRAFRILRILRLINLIPDMRRVMEGLLASLPGIAAVASIMFLFFYVFSVIATNLYGSSFPEWFGSLGKTMYTLFQVMTLDSWSTGVVRPMLIKHPNAWLFFMLYIFVSTFTMLNLFIAIIVNAMHKGADKKAQESRMKLKKSLSEEIKEMEGRIVSALKDSRDKK